MINYFLQPENIVISKKPAKIITILGSCVSVCIYDIKLKYGGVNHYLLPVCNSTSVAKLGNKATFSLIKKMLNKGSQKKTI
jgi:chemotaxis protein CheD